MPETTIIGKITERIIVSTAASAIMKKLNIKSLCPNKDVVNYDLSKPNETELFYQKVSSAYANASQEIYIVGSGSRPADSRDIFLVQHDGIRKALQKKAKFYRFQTNKNWSPEWSKTYSYLSNEYSEQVEIYEDFLSSQMTSIAIIDPDNNPIWIETRQTQSYTNEHEVTVLFLGLIMYNQKDMVVNFKNQLLARKSSLQKILLSVND
jgi:hypothetical protein